jgi:hypothetical protein
MAAENKLAVEITEQKSITTIHFKGDYGPLSIVLMKEIVNALIRNERLKLIFRFDHLEKLDQEAYGYLEWVHDEVSRLGGAVVLICPQDESLPICSKLKQNYHFLIFPSFRQARAYFVEREF